MNEGDEGESRDGQKPKDEERDNDLVNGVALGGVEMVHSCEYSREWARMIWG